MSTIKVTNIQATGETATRAVSGVTAAWVDGNGTGTVSSDDSLNVSSITDGGVGYYTHNFVNSFAGTAYCPQTTGRGDGTSEGGWQTATRVPSASNCLTNYFTIGGNYQDQTAFSFSALGDLA